MPLSTKISLGTLWSSNMNADMLKVDIQMDALTWERAKWETFDTQGIKVEEITTGVGVRREGREMEHCVFFSSMTV